MRTRTKIRGEMAILAFILTTIVGTILAIKGMCEGFGDVVGTSVPAVILGFSLAAGTGLVIGNMVNSLLDIEPHGPEWGKEVHVDQEVSMNHLIYLERELQQSKEDLFDMQCQRDKANSELRLLKGKVPQQVYSTVGDIQRGMESMFAKKEGQS